MKRSTRTPFVSAVYEECRSNHSAQLKPARFASCLNEEQPGQRYECDLCGKKIEGLPASSGLLLWHRGDEMRIEQPPLCDKCAARITIGAVVKWATEGDEEG